MADLIGTTSGTSFTQLATFGKRHHSLPYSILCDSPRKLHPNDIFSQYSHVGVPKLELLLSWNFGRSYFPQIKFIWSMWGHYFIVLKNIFLMVYLTLIIDYLTFALTGFVIGNQIENLILTFFFISELMHKRSSWTMRRHFKHLHFKTFPMVCWGSNLMFFCLSNQGSKHSGL